MTDKEKIIEIMRASGYGYFLTHDDVDVEEALEQTASALIVAGIGDVKEAKFESDHYWRMWQGSLVELERAEHRAEVAKRALVITAERVLEYAEKANMTAMTSDGFFSCDKDAQLALLANDALLKAEADVYRRLIARIE